jgi:branched-chain amino acid aminotransferase
MKKFNAEQSTAFLRDQFLPFKDAGLNIASSPVLYGLAVYTVFGLNWNQTSGVLYTFRFKDHYARLVNSTRLMGFTGADGKGFATEWPYERFENTMLELVRKNKIREDALVRVSVFVDGIIAGTRISGLPIAVSAFVYSLGQILRPEGIRVCVSSWRHNPDDVIPNRAKVNGAYVSNCLMKNEALLNGFDDAIALDHRGHVTEGTVANLFLARNGRLITPSVDSDILEGITRDTILRLAADMNIPVEERTVDRTELYIADEAFVCGSSARVVPILGIDHRTIGDGKAGPLTQKLAAKYLAVQRGTDKGYKEWRMEIAIPKPRA